MRSTRGQLVEALIACGYERAHAEANITGCEKAVVTAYLRRVEQRVFGPRGEANWYHVTNPAGEQEWVLRGSKVKAIMEEEMK